MQALNEQDLNVIVSAFVNKCSTLFGKKLSDVRIFGSYARGDYCSESDIDIMIILCMSEDEVRKSLDDICKIASELDLLYNVTISPVLMSSTEYDLRKYSYGFCGNVEKEGISKHAGQPVNIFTNANG